MTRAAWLAERRRGIGGSDIAAVLGMSRWASPRDVWLDKTGRAPEKPATWAMRKGIVLEPLILEWFAERTGRRVERSGMLRHPEHDWALVNVDALVDDDGIAEVKTASWWVRDEWDAGQVADAAELQSQWGLFVTGRSKAYVIAAISDDEPVIRERDRDQALIDMMRERAERFWHDHVLADVEPPLLPVDLGTVRKEYPVVERARVVADPSLEPAFERRAAAITAIKFHEAAKSQAEAEITAAIADADELVIAGQVWATRKEQVSRVLSAELLADAGLNPDDYKAPRVSRVLRVADPDKRKDVA